MNITSISGITGRKLAILLITGAFAAMPFGLIAVSANAATVTPADYNNNDGRWQNDCDHTGNMMWQQNRGNWEWSDCDNSNGHWQQNDRDGQWQWHRDSYNAPAPSMFGSA
ncbi:hypothetical protein ACIP5Y_23805 [Nocardia sp. NPDC088792]|uniref:hypothetical protein n=1 Tax=Nocardia sp. NPDC088792 TaxID=3364332 RepID=UPI0037FFAD8F